jgi:hypothetical protein
MTGQGQHPHAYAEFGPLATELRYVERSARRLARATFYGMARWQGGLERRQGFLGRIVDIGAELFAMSASVVRAEMLRTDDPAQGASAYELAEAFCQQARVRVDALFTALWHNTDTRDVELAHQVLTDRYAWLEDGILDPAPEGPWIAAADPGPTQEHNVARRFLPSTRS